MFNLFNFQICTFLFFFTKFPLICLAHEPGLVKLQVAMNGTVISNTVIFEFKSKANNSNAYKRLEIDDLLLTTNLEDAATEAELQQPDKQR